MVSAIERIRAVQHRERKPEPVRFQLPEADSGVYAIQDPRPRMETWGSYRVWEVRVPYRGGDRKYNTDSCILDDVIDLIQELTQRAMITGFYLSRRVEHEVLDVYLRGRRWPSHILGIMRPHPQEMVFMDTWAL